MHESVRKRCNSESSCSVGIPAGLRPEVLGRDHLGIHGSFRLGVQRKVATGIPGSTPERSRVLLIATSIEITGVLCAVFGMTRIAASLLLLASVLAIWSLRLLASAQQRPKSKGLHPTWPVFIRISYSWLIIGAVLGIWASTTHDATGVVGASRHALTVGFIASMVFSIGQRILPAFAGMKMLWSPRLMLLASSLLTIGCILRVTCEVLAYQGYAQWAWKVLPCSAVIELSAVTVFALDIVASFASSRAPVQGQIVRPAKAPVSA